MTLRIIDGFDYAPTGVNVNLFEAMGWSGTVGSIQSVATSAFDYGRSIGMSTNENNYYVYKDLRGRYNSDLTHTVWGCRHLVQPSGRTIDFAFLDSWSGVTTQFQIQFNALGNITFTDGAGVAHRTPAWSFFPGRWFYFEAKWKSGAGTSGSIELRVNTVVVLSVPACATAAGVLFPEAGGKTGVDVLSLHASGGDNLQHLLDDFYLLDSLGTVNNDYLGNARAKWMAPTANSSVTWTIGGSSPAATNWQSVLNSAVDDTKFNYSNTPGQRDLYTIDPNLSTPYVFGVEVDGIFRQDDATQRVARNTLQTSIGTDIFGPDIYTNGYYTNNEPLISEINPDTTVAWTGAEVNAALIGPEVIT